MSSFPVGMRDLVCGLDREVPLLDGRWRRYVNFDNAATTPPFRSVLDSVNRAVEWYGSVHRGSGSKSLLSTHLYHRCRKAVHDFVGADPDYHAVVFCSNTTDALNRLCRCLSLRGEDVILATEMEHHSNLLPWRSRAKVDYARVVGRDGSLDVADLERKLRGYGGRVKLVAVTGASNVTGLVSPLEEIACLAHRYGAKLLVDGAQLVAHRSIRMGSASDCEHIDFLAFSGHKMYAPFGAGILVGPRECFEQGDPYPVGGGAVELVTLQEVEWSAVPDRQEAGSPNLIGALALWGAIQTLQALGMEKIRQHERELL